MPSTVLAVYIGSNIIRVISVSRIKRFQDTSIIQEGDPLPGNFLVQKLENSIQKILSKKKTKDTSEKVKTEKLVGL